MRKRFFVAMILCILLMPVVASGIEPTTDVKVTPLLKASTSWNGDQIIYPRGKAEITGLLVEVAPGKETGWHSHTVPSFAYMLEGVLEVQLKDGRTKRIKAGDALAEVINTWHNGRNVGNVPVKIVVFYTGIAGTAVSIKAPASAAGEEKNKK
jgi:quercetin dioxygenase-like cupin family protein